MNSTDKELRVGRVLRALRLKCGHSQEEVARELKIALRTYAAWENDETNPNLENLVKLHGFFHRFDSKLKIADLIPANSVAGAR